MITFSHAHTSKPGGGPCRCHLSTEQARGLRFRVLGECHDRPSPCCTAEIWADFDGARAKRPPTGCSTTLWRSAPCTWPWPVEAIACVANISTPVHVEKNEGAFGDAVPFFACELELLPSFLLWVQTFAVSKIKYHVGNTCDACGIFVPWPPPKSMRAGELKRELLSFGSLGVETPA